MLFHLTAIITAALTIPPALAAPTPHSLPELDDLTCQCLTFHASGSQSPCHFLDTPGFDWRTAHSLASQYDLKLRFARASTVARILAIPAPLPSDVLQVVGNGDAQSAGQRDVSRSEIVCGLSREEEDLVQREGDEQGGFVGKVVAWLMLMVVVWAAAERVWSRWLGRVRLEGEERRIKATQGGDDVDLVFS